MFITGTNHENFVRFNGRVKLSKKVGPRGGRRQGIVVDCSVSYGKHLWCDKNKWPTNTPAHIFCAYQCREHQISDWNTPPFDLQKVVESGHTAFIKSKISLIKSAHIVNHRLFAAKKSPGLAQEIILLKNHCNFLVASPTFCQFIEKGIFQNNLFEKVYSELRETLPPNRTFNLGKMSIPAGITFRIIQCKERTLFAEIVKMGHRLEADQNARAALFINPPVIPDDSLQNISVITKDSSESDESLHSILSDVFADLSGPGVNEMQNTFYNENAKVIRSVGITISNESQLEASHSSQKEYDVHSVTRKMALKNFCENNYFYTPGDLDVPQLHQLKTKNYKDMVELNSKISMQKAYLDALAMEANSMIIHHRQYHAGLLDKLPENSENASTQLKRDIDKIVLRIAKLDSVITKINKKRESNIEKIKTLREAMLKSDLAKFSDLEFNIVEPFNTHFQAIKFLSKRKNPFKTGSISDSDFPSIDSLCTDTGRDFLKFYDEILKSSVFGIETQLKKIAEMHSHFVNFNQQISSILNSDFQSAEKAEKLMQIVHAYGGRKSVVNNDPYFEAFNILKKSTDTESLAPKFDNTPDFLNVSIPTLYDLKTDKPVPKKRAIGQLNELNLSVEQPSTSSGVTSSTPQRPSSLFQTRLTETQTANVLAKKSKFSEL